MKNYVKSRNNCISMIENKIIRKLPSLNSENVDDTNDIKSVNSSCKYIPYNINFYFINLF